MEESLSTTPEPQRRTLFPVSGQEVPLPPNNSFAEPGDNSWLAHRSPTLHNSSSEESLTNEEQSPEPDERHIVVSLNLPVLNPRPIEADLVVMAPVDNLAPTGVETAAQAEIESSLEEAEQYLAQDEPDLASTYSSLENIEAQLKELQTKTFTRIGRIQDQAARTQQKQQWVTWKTGVMRKYRAQWADYLDKNRDYETPERIVERKLLELEADDAVLCSHKQP